MKIQSVERDSFASYQLDLIRGLAALMVLAGHAVGLFLYLPKEQPTSWIGTAAYYASAYGHEAVMIFFVLSGFLVGSTVVKQVEQGRWSWGNYAISRLTRLMIVLIPALLIGFGLDRLGIYNFGESGIYGGGPVYHGIIPGAVSAVATWPTFWGNLFFLQTIKFWTLGSNGPLWSLAFEFWYYVIFPLLWIGLKGKNSILVRALFVIAACACLAFIGKHAAIRFAIWLLGVGVAMIPPVPGLGRPIARNAALLVLVGITVATHFSRFHASLIADTLVGLTFATFLLTTLNAPNRDLSQSRKWVSRGLSNVSYTVYLFHLPMLVFLHALLVPAGSLLPANAGNVGMVVGLVVSVFAVCVGMWWLFESRTDVVRKWVQSKFLPRAI